MSLEDLKDGRVAVKQNIDQYSRFLKPTIPEGQLGYYNPVMPLVGKELSIGNIYREDMLGHLPMVTTIQKLLNYGQIGLHRRFMIGFQAELKLTMSFDGKFMEQIAANKFEYTQEQHVYEHGLDEPRRKRGLFGGLMGGN
jgi:hypothetical protein